MYRRLCGAEALLRRSVKGPGLKPEMISHEIPVKCSIWGWGNVPRESSLAGTSQKQVEYAATVLEESLEKAQWPGGILIGDKLVVGGRVFNVETVDTTSRSVAGELVAYELTLKG